MECFCIEREFDEILRIMETKKQTDPTSWKRRIFNIIQGVAAIIAVSAIGFSISYLFKMVSEGSFNTSDKIATCALMVSLTSLLISAGDYFEKGIKKKEYFVFYVVKNCGEVERLLSELPQRAQEKKMEIRDIDVFEYDNKTYLKIYY